MTKRKLPPDPEKMNRQRSESVRNALLAFAKGHGEEDLDWDTMASDFLADLAHFCDRHDLSFADLVRRARNHYVEETDMKGTQLNGGL